MRFFWENDKSGTIVAFIDKGVLYLLDILTDWSSRMSRGIYSPLFGKREIILMESQPQQSSVVWLHYKNVEVEADSVVSTMLLLGELAMSGVEGQLLLRVLYERCRGETVTVEMEAALLRKLFVRGLVEKDGTVTESFKNVVLSSIVEKEGPETLLKLRRPYLPSDENQKIMEQAIDKVIETLGLPKDSPLQRRYLEAHEIWLE